MEAVQSLEASRRGLRHGTLAVVVFAGSAAIDAIRAAILGSFGLRHEILLACFAVLLGFAWINWRRGVAIRVPNEDLKPTATPSSLVA
jgi:hypothetical protein